MTPARHLILGMVLTGSAGLIDVVGFIDLHQHDREVARDPVGPERRGSLGLPHQHVGRCTQRASGVQDRPTKGLEQVRFVGSDAKVAQLDLSLGPGQCGGALEGRDIVILVGEVEDAGS